MLVQRSVRKFFVVSISALAWFSAPAYAQTNYYYTAPVADFPTTSATFTPVTGCSLSLTPGSTSENWVVMATGQVRGSTNNEAQAARVQLVVQGTTEAEAGVQNDPVNEATGFFMMHRITGTTASQTIQVEAQNPFGGAVTTTVEQCSITAFLVPSAADFQWTEVDGPLVPPGGNCVTPTGPPILTHQFTPASAGDYLFITSFVAFEFPDGSTNKTWVNYPIAATDAPDFGTFDAWSNGRDPRQSYVSMRRETLPASQQTLDIMCEGSTLGSTMLWAKAASFRMDAFEADYHDEDLTEVTYALTPWLTHSTLFQPAPAASTEFLMLGTISGCTNSGTAGPRHGMRFREDSSGSPVVRGQSVWGINRDCSYGNGLHNSFQWVEPYTTASSRTWDNQYQSTDAPIAANFAESAIHVLQFDTAPPTPDPMTFASAPNDASTTSISMTSTTGRMPPARSSTSSPSPPAGRTAAPPAPGRPAPPTPTAGSRSTSATAIP